MPQELKTFRGYSTNSFEEALDNAIAQVKVDNSGADMLYHYPILSMGKEVGGIGNRKHYYVVISLVE